MSDRPLRLSVCPREAQAESRLSDQLPHRFAFRDQFERPTVLSAVPGMERHAERVVDSGGEVRWTHGTVDNILAERIRGANHLADLDAAAAHACDAGGRPVVASRR